MKGAVVKSMAALARATLHPGAILLLTAAAAWGDTAHKEHYVWSGSSTPGAPYHAWTNAAHDIQAAVNYAVNGDTVWVTNGVYINTTNQIYIKKAITLRSVEGAEKTIIDGNYPIITNRCMTLWHATGDGFTFRNGGLGGIIVKWAILHNSIITKNRTDAYVGGGGLNVGDVGDGSGGGVVSNCVISSNFSTTSGGGVTIVSPSGQFGSVLRNSLIVSNVSQFRGGGIYAPRQWSQPNTCLIENCRIVGNVASNAGGGVELAIGNTIRNSLVASNTCTGTYWSWVAGNGTGGGMRTGRGIVENCTIVMNRASKSGGGLHGEVTNGVANSIIALNFAPAAPGVSLGSGLTAFTNSYLQSRADVADNPYCTTNGQCRFDVDPRFINNDAGVFRLRQSSPCVDAGVKLSWMPFVRDLDGNPRLRGGVVDMGAYEANPSGSLMLVR